MTSYAIFIILALLSTVLINQLLRHRFKWWVLFLFAIIPNFIIGVLLIFIIATIQYDHVSFNFTEDNLAGKFGESFSTTILAFILISPLFKNKEQREKPKEERK